MQLQIMAEFYNDGEMIDDLNNGGRNERAAKHKKLSKTTRARSPIKESITPLEDKIHDIKRNNFNASSHQKNSARDDEQAQQKQRRKDKRSKTTMRFHGENIPLPDIVG